MIRDLRTTLAIVAVVLILGAPVLFADAPQTQGTSSYLALVFQDLIPTPVPTPVPAPIQTLTIQLSEMKSGYVQDRSEEVTNAAAAKNYHDPKAAAAAFVQQGRETSWLVLYSSTDYLFSDAFVVGNQVFRYLTVAGATDGFNYTNAEVLRDHPDFRPFNVSLPCCPLASWRRTYKEDDITLDHFYFNIQVGRYVTEVNVIGLAGSVSVSRAIQYAQLALDHVYDTPQLMRAESEDGPAPASEPQPGTIDAAIEPR